MSEKHLGGIDEGTLRHAYVGIVKKHAVISHVRCFKTID